MNQFNKTYNKIIKEEESSFVNNQKPKKELEVDDIFEVYEEVGMSAEMGFEDLIGATVLQIKAEVRPEHQRLAYIAVRKMWRERLDEFMRTSWVNNPRQA